MLFEPVLHDMYAEDIRKVFTDWNDELNQLRPLLPVDARPFGNDCPRT